ncbi:GrpB family protein [Bacillus sp. CGMCC 1.16541]|uniref:GrpB family protein n=1 Tax=Bacillus sp. CGMCC 1.16541 TaxID=2185143 RepID=UPI000D727823|nr:GrpB family protein [Bacillus sp. CGMCC 1.16541]
MVELVNYETKWPLLYQFEKANLQRLLKDYAPQIEHIGSTAVSGLSAKPIVDIMIGVKHKEDLDGVSLILANRGYTYLQKYNDMMPYRRFFIGLKDGVIKEHYPTVITSEVNDEFLTHEKRSTHIHVTTTDSAFWTDHLLFRDYLKENRHTREQYESLKTKLSAYQWANGNEYAQAKGEFIQRVLEKAKMQLVK